MNMLKDQKGQTSSMRVMSIIIIVFALLLSVFSVYMAFVTKHTDIGGNMVALILGLIGIGVTGKVVQKGIEK